MRIFLRNEIKSCLALYWNSLLMLLRLFMVCGIAHFGFTGVTIADSDPSAAFCTHTRLYSHSLHY